MQKQEITSLINKMNTMGPMCEPWGTPKCTNTSLEVE